MNSGFIDLVDIDGATLRGYRALPAAGKGPAVLVLQEIFGVNEAMRAVADELAEAGFVAFVPDLFWRLQADVQLDYDEAGRERAFDLWKRFDLERGRADLVAAVQAVHARPEVTGGVALLGFCLGGQLTVKTAASIAVDAAVCFYGTQLGDALADIAAIDAPTLFHFGDDDPHVPAEVREAVAGVAADKPAMSVTVHPGAGHGFFNRFRAVSFHRQAHDLARQQSLALLRGALMAAPANGNHNNGLA